MSKLILLLALLYTQQIAAQLINDLNGKWAFTGLRTTVFKVENEMLYIGMLDYSDTANFNRFVQGLPVDSSVFKQTVITQKPDTIFIQATFPYIDHTLYLIYLSEDPNNILFTGDVFFDSTKVISTNNNCNLNSPGCINRLYTQSDLQAMMQLKSIETFTRDDAFEFLLRLNQTLKSRCNKCYAGFTDAYMNQALVDMGFNPIVKRTGARSVWYNTSGFNAYLKTKFGDDKRLIKLSELIFNWYLHSPNQTLR